MTRLLSALLIGATALLSAAEAPAQAERADRRACRNAVASALDIRPRSVNVGTGVELRNGVAIISVGIPRSAFVCLVGRTGEIRDIQRLPKGTARLANREDTRRCRRSVAEAIEIRGRRLDVVRSVVFGNGTVWVDFHGPGLRAHCVLDRRGRVYDIVVM